MLPGLKFATIAASPVFGGKVGHVDDGAAKKIPGVQKRCVLDDMVAVVGDHMWAAKRGLDSLAISWDGGVNGHVEFRLDLEADQGRQPRRAVWSPKRSAMPTRR